MEREAKAIRAQKELKSTLNYLSTYMKEEIKDSISPASF